MVYVEPSYINKKQITTFYLAKQAKRVLTAFKLDVKLDVKLMLMSFEQHSTKIDWTSSKKPIKDRICKHIAFVIMGLIKAQYIVIKCFEN